MKGAALLQEFAHDFGAPFLSGGPLTIDDPLGRDGLLAIKHGMTIDTALADAVEAQLTQAAFFADITPAPFDEDTATLLYAGHDLFASVHPQASQSFYARAHTFCRVAEHELQLLPRTLEPRRLLTRHLIVERLFQATRADTHVKWWTGKASFYGEEAPKRLMAWPSIRRVNVDARTTPMWKLALSQGDEELRLARSALMSALLDVSPLTRLVLLGDNVQKQLGFSLLLPYKMRGKKVSPLDVLEDKRLARAVTDALLARGVELSGPTLALSLLSAVREGAPPRVLRRAAELCAHLVVVAALLEAEMPGAPEAAFLRSFFDDDISQMNDAVRVFWATVGAVVELDGTTFDVPSEDELPEVVLPIFARLRERLKHKRVRAVGDPLARELQRHLPTVDKDTSSAPEDDGPDAEAVG